MRGGGKGGTRGMDILCFKLANDFFDLLATFIVPDQLRILMCACDVIVAGLVTS